MDKKLFELLTKATYSLGTFHSMLTSSNPLISESLQTQITHINNKQFLKRTNGFNVFFTLYKNEIKNDNKGKTKMEIYKIAKDIYCNKFDKIMRDKFESMGKIKKTVVSEARTDTMNEIMERGNVKVKSGLKKQRKKETKPIKNKKINNKNKIDKKEENIDGDCSKLEEQVDEKVKIIVGINKNVDDK